MKTEKHDQSNQVIGYYRDSATAAESGTKPRSQADLLLMVALQLGWCLFQLFHSNVIAYNAGYGWDGNFYGTLAQNFHWADVYHAIDSYRMHRVLPSIVVGLMLNALNAHTIAATVLSFRILSVIELVVAVIGWWKIASRLGYDKIRTWLGFTLLFVNFPLMSNAFYYPILTDVTAFVLGMWIVYGFLTGNTALLMALGLIGAFCWPVCAPACAVLILFPLQRPAGSEPWVRSTVVLCAIGAAVIVGMGLLARFGFGIHQMTYATAPMNDALLPLSALIQFTLLTLATVFLLGRLHFWRVLAQVRAASVARWLCALAVVIVPSIIIMVTKKDVAPGLSLRLYLGVLTFASLVRPALTPVGHFAYFGFVIPLLGFNWRRIGALADRVGLGLIGFLSLSLLVALPPEARQSFMSFPAIVVLLCCVAGSGWTSREVLGLGVLQFLLARPWFDQNAGYRADLEATENLPAYFASQGTFMSDKAYEVFLALLILAIGICYVRQRLVKNRRRVSTREIQIQ